MKTVGSSGHFIDYTTTRFGVRVREKVCRTIELTDAGWEEYGQEIRLPVAPHMIVLSTSDDPGDLPTNLLDYETHSGSDVDENRQELRELLLGEIDIWIALNRRLRDQTLRTAPL